MKLLILTNREDFTADYLGYWLTSRGRDVVRLNSEDMTTSRPEFRDDGSITTRRLQIGEHDVDLAAVTSIWYRRAIFPRAAPEIDPLFQPYASGEWRHFFQGMLLDPSAQWVNPIEAVNIAERKVFQLRVARQVGFDIPRTLVTNSSTQLRSFCAGMHRTICKPIFHGLARTTDGDFAVHTRIVSESDFSDDEQHRLCPTMVQEYIPKGVDVRVTVIGQRLFALAISGRDGEVVDWREHHANVRYSPIELPHVVRGYCFNMLAKLRLAYGAFDFVVSMDGRWVFLEVNPTGEWAWLENEHGLPLRPAFDELFFGA